MACPRDFFPSLTADLVRAGSAVARFAESDAAARFRDALAHLCIAGWVQIPVAPASTTGDGVWRPAFSSGAALPLGWYGHRTQHGGEGHGLLCSFTAPFEDEQSCQQWCAEENAKVKPNE